MTGPRARDPQPGEPEYGEHLALRIAQEIGAIRRDRSPLHLARAVVAMPEVRALLEQAGDESRARWREQWGDAFVAADRLDEIDRLRARVAELEGAGNALYQLATDPTARDAWRSTGAPTEQPGDGIDPTIASGYRLEDIRDLSPRDLGFGADGHSDEQAGGERDA